MARETANRPTNPVISRKGSSIGSISAEQDDAFLFECFVKHPLIDEITDFTSQAMIISGKTGSGKTAILRYIENKNQEVCQLELAEMALSYIANSDVIRFLTEIGADLDLLFQIIWKHVLCVEYIKLKYKLIDTAQSKGWFDWVKDLFDSDQRRHRALKYLHDWQHNFWVTADENVKTITRKYEDALKSELGSDLRGIKASISASDNNSVELKSELHARIRSIVNEEQLADLNRVLDLLSSETINSKTNSWDRHFILIDRIDERWVDDSLRFKLIRALIESLKAFRKIHSLKIVVAMRMDVIERVILETKDIGFQSEKYKDYFSKLSWDAGQIKQFVDSRINLLYKRQYTAANVGFDEIFCDKIDGRETFEYMINKTLLRPRDMLVFVNECLDAAAGETIILPKHIYEAERRYSSSRLKALIEEWKSAYPTLEFLMPLFQGAAATIELSDIATEKRVEDLALIICTAENVKWDPMFARASSYLNSPNDQQRLEFAREMASMLYLVGFAGLKLYPHEPFIYSHIDEPAISPSSIGWNAKVRVHAMLHRALNINTTSHHETGEVGQ